jgi:cytoskeletal protein CcmA (bactofilin family)
MGRNLSNLYISSSFQFLTQISGSELQTGLGDKITGSLDITSSKADTATSASFASTSVSSSYSTNALSSSYSATALSSSYATNALSASYAVTASYSETTAPIKTIYETVYAGENLTKTDPVYLSGSVGANPIAYKADAGDPAKSPAVYIMNETISSGATGQAIALGLIEGINLTGYNAGQEVYLGVGGGWTATRPTGSASVQILGVVTKGGAGGKGFVFNAGEATLPNLTAGYAWVGNTNGVPVAVATSSFSTSVNTGSLIVTGSVNSNTLTFTKGDGSTFNLTVATGSGGGTINTGSLLVTASSTDATITYTKGDGSTFTNVINNVSASISASYAATATSSSHALTANTATSASFATTATSASQANNANTAISASYATNALSSSYALTASFALNVPSINTSSLATTGSNTFIGNETISGSLNVSGSVTGNVLGNNTDIYTGSAPIQQVVTLTAAEYTAISASANANTFYVISDSTAFNPSTFATTGSNTFNGNQIISGSLTVTGAISGSIVSASYAATASYADSGFKVGQLTIKTPGATNNDNTIIGRDAGFKINSDKNSTLIGSNAGYNLTGNDNVAVGDQALFGQISNDSTGSNNVAVGTNAGLQIKDGNGNVAVGDKAMYTVADFPSNADASYNTVVGNSAAKKLYFGDNNTVIGSLTGQLLSTGSNNTIIGANYSGSDFNNTVVLTDGQGNVQFYATGGLATLTSITTTSTASFNGFVILSQVSASLNFVDDTAAATGGVPLGGLYRNGNAIMIRLT